MAQRLSNYELLRVISMISIVYHHFGVHSSFAYDYDDHSFRNIHLQLITSFGKVGVDLFMMLTGYFLAGKAAKVSTVVRIWLQSFTYSWAFYLIFWLLGREMDYDDKINSLFPVVHYGYWFITAYTGVVLMSPAYGKMAANMVHAEYAGLLFVFFLYLCVLTYNFEYAYSDIFYFSFLYLIGSYLKLFQSAYAKVKTLTYFIILVILLVLNFTVIYYLSYHRYEWVNNYGGPWFLMIHNSSPLALSISVVTFLLVGRLEFHSPIINLAAGVSLGIYLIHENRFLRYVIWIDWVRGHDYYWGPAFEYYSYSLIAPLCVYIACGAIEWCRQKLLTKLESKLTFYIENIIISIGNFIAYHLHLTEDTFTECKEEESLLDSTLLSPVSV